jgi:hypothetical protein
MLTHLNALQYAASHGELILNKGDIMTTMKYNLYLVEVTYSYSAHFGWSNRKAPEAHTKQLVKTGDNLFKYDVAYRGLSKKVGSHLYKSDTHGGSARYTYVVSAKTIKEAKQVALKDFRS